MTPLLLIKISSCCLLCFLWIFWSCFYSNLKKIQLKWPFKSKISLWFENFAFIYYIYTSTLVILTFFRLEPSCSQDILMYLCADQDWMLTCLSMPKISILKEENILNQTLLPVFYLRRRKEPSFYYTCFDLFWCGIATVLTLAVDDWHHWHHSKL